MKVHFNYPEDIGELEDRLIDYLTDVALKNLTPEEIELILSAKLEEEEVQTED